MTNPTPTPSTPAPAAVTEVELQEMEQFANGFSARADDAGRLSVMLSRVCRELRARLGAVHINTSGCTESLDAETAQAIDVAVRKLRSLR